jgi:hypothetical protein
MTATYPSAQTAYSRIRAMGTMRDVKITQSFPTTASELAGRPVTTGHDWSTP